MFYAHFVLAKKGPLAKIWLAAHWDKKLTKAHVFETNIEKSVDGILKPKVKMALRTSGHLLLGVVRIYSRKAKYLLQDCNEAFVKIKMAFRPGMVDLPEEHREAAMNAITLPEVFHDFDTAMPELNEVDIEAQFSLNQSRAEEITMREDYGSLNLVTHDDGFGDMGFDTDNPDIMREAIGNEAGLEQSNLVFGEGSSLELGGKEPAAGSSLAEELPLQHQHQLQQLPHQRMEAAPHAIDDAFAPPIGDVPDFGRDYNAGGLFEGDLFGSVGGGGVESGSRSLQAEIDAGVSEADAAAADAHAPDSDNDMDDHYDDMPMPMTTDTDHHSWDASPAPPTEAEIMPPPAPPEPEPPAPMEVEEPAAAAAEAEPAPAPPSPRGDHTTLLHNDEESFALAPVDATVLKGITKTKRKRKLIVDEVKNISGEEMKNQLSNTSDIVTTLDLAPPTRRLMHWKETGGVEKLFTLPARQIPSTVLFKKYQRNMTLRSDEEAEGGAGAARSPAGGAEREPQPARRHPRKRRLDESIAAARETPAPDLEPPTPAPVPHEYEPSAGMLSALGGSLTGPLGALTPGSLLQGGLTPATGGALSPGLQALPPGGALGLDPSITPGGLDHGGLTHGHMTPAGLAHGGMTPAGLAHGGMTPAGLTHGGMTPAGLAHGGMTPAGLAHGGITPAGLAHGGMTPAGLAHGGMTPAGLAHGGMTPAGLAHGGMTPAGLGHGGMTPAGLAHGGMTPAGLAHGGMTPAGLTHGGMTPAGLTHGGMTPAGLAHGGMTPTGLSHGEHPGLRGALLHGAGGGRAMLPAVAHDPTLNDLAPHYTENNMNMTNLGYEENAPHSPHHDYDLPATPDNEERGGGGGGGGGIGEREAGETEQQFEERVLNRRAAQLFAALRPALLRDEHAAVPFRDLAPPHNRRKQVAQKFYSLLVLKKHQVLKLEQHETYGPIIIHKGDQFETDAI